MVWKILVNSFFFMLITLSALSCSSSKVSQKPASKMDETVQKDLEPVKASDMTKEELQYLKRILDALEDIPFDFDSYAIPSQGRDVLKKDIELLNKILEKRGKMVRFVLEGHCDDRGSEEYNLALGERRAQAVNDYLLTLGFRYESLHIISYGEEKPKINAQTVEAWAANRRVHIVVE
jgi:peptidoglycan-associated lipoprotein